MFPEVFMAPRLKTLGFPKVFGPQGSLAQTLLSLFPQQDAWVELTGHRAALASGLSALALAFLAPLGLAKLYRLWTWARGPQNPEKTWGS